MGNAMGMGGGRARSTKTQVMKLDGETFKLNTPTKALDVIKNHPDHVLLESESLKNYGLQAKPLEPHHHLLPKKLYFLLHLPDHHRRPRAPGAADRLQGLMSGRRPVAAAEGGSVKVKVRLRRDQVEKMVNESKDRAEVAEKIVKLYASDDGVGGEGGGARSAAKEKRVSFVQ